MLPVIPNGVFEVRDLSSLVIQKNKNRFLAALGMTVSAMSGIAEENVIAVSDANPATRERVRAR
jgi:hypothetical protein